MTEWDAFVSRLTLFPGAPPSGSLPSAHELYRKIWGGDPDNFQKAQNALSPAVAQGKRGSMMAHCLIHPTRIDLNLGAAPSREARMDLPLIKDTSELRAEMERMINAIRGGVIASPIFRVALFMQFLSLQPSFAEANNTVSSIIPSKYGVKVSNEEDFIFQINRPYASQVVSEITMNSLVKWSVERIQVVAVQIPIGGSVGSAAQGTDLPVPQSAGFIAGSVSLDINNQHSKVPLDGRQQSMLLLEAQTASNRIQQEIGLNIAGFSDSRLSAESKGPPNVKPN